MRVCIPDTEKRSTNHYRERLYKEVELFKKDEKRRIEEADKLKHKEKAFERTIERGGVAQSATRATGA